MRIIKAKMKGKKVKLEEADEGPADPKVIDLMSRLRESLEQGRAKPAGGKTRASRAGGDGERPTKGTRTRKRRTA
jgi:non-homologous end joining protein Ku